MLLAWLRSLPARKKAHRAARRAASRMESHEPILGSAMRADEPSRFVVSVFIGQREPYEHRLPPWRKCLVFGVDKVTFEARLELGEKYRPVIR